jgi:hypothetical protein
MEPALRGSKLNGLAFKKFQVSGFSVPRFRFASDGISASLQQV